MAATTRGTAHLYGIDGTIATATVQDFKQKDQHQNTDATVDESGNEIERRYDDLAKEATITLKIQSGYTIPVPATTLVYKTITWEIVLVEKVETAKGFRMVTLTLKKTEYVV